MSNTTGQAQLEGVPSVATYTFKAWDALSHRNVDTCVERTLTLNPKTVCTEGSTVLSSQNQPSQVRELLWTLEMSPWGSQSPLFRGQHGSSQLPFSFSHPWVAFLGDFG